MNDNGMELDLKDFFRMILKKFWIIALCAAILGTSALVYTMNFVQPQYQASTTIYINNNSGSSNTSVSSGDLAVALRLVASYVNIIQSDKVLDKVVQETGLNLTAAQIKGMIKAEPMGETEMLMVTVKTPHPQMSADIANAVAKVAPGEITQIIEGSSAKIVDYAKVPQSPSSPNYSTSFVLGALIGAFLVIGVIVLQMVTDVRVKNEDDLAKICAIPVLGAIPQLNAETRTTGKKTTRR